MSERIPPVSGSRAGRQPASLGSIRRDALLIFGLALFLWLVHLWSLSGSLFFSVTMIDTLSYDEWASRLAGGDWIGTEAFYQAPLYPYFIGVIYGVFGSDLMYARFAQALLGALAVESFQNAVAINSDLALSRNSLGEGLLAAGRPSDAAQEFERARELRPNNRRARDGLDRARAAMAEDGD